VESLTHAMVHSKSKKFLSLELFDPYCEYEKVADLVE